MLQRYIDPDGKPKSDAPEPRQLISKEASTADLYVTYDKVSFDENSGIITFANLRVMRISTGAVLTARPTVSIRVIS